MGVGVVAIVKTYSLVFYTKGFKHVAQPNVSFPCCNVMGLKAISDGNTSHVSREREKNAVKF